MALKLEERRRPTIMDGIVVTIATGFNEREGFLGPHEDATGPFEVSASRNAVVVHRASFMSIDGCEALIKAIRRAFALHTALRHGQEPDEV